MSKIRIGVFQIGDDWRVWGQDGALGRFDDQHAAIAAARAVARLSIAQGLEAEIHLLDKSGEIAVVDAGAN